MNRAFEKHIDKRISEMRERIRNSRLKKKIEMKTFGQRVEKATQAGKNPNVYEPPSYAR